MPPLSKEEFLKLSPDQQNELSGSVTPNVLSKEEFFKLNPLKQSELAIGPNKKAPSEASSFFQNAADSVALGYLPEITAGVTKAVGPLYDFITGTEVSKALPSYTKIRDEEYANLKRDAEVNPKASLAGKIGGALLGGIGTGGGGFIARGGTTLGKVARAGAVGGGIGLIQNPGAEIGTIDPFQGEERLKNAVIGTAVGAGLQGLGSAASKFVKGPKDLKALANEKAFKVTGAGKKAFEVAQSKGQVQKIGQELLDSGLVTSGTSTTALANKLESVVDDVGSQIGKVITEADRAAGPSAINVPTLVNDLGKRLNTQSLKGVPGADGSAKMINGFLESLLENGENISLKRAWDIKRAIDAQLKAAYRSKKFVDFPEAQSALLEIRNALRDQINGVVGKVAPKSNLPNLLSKYSNLVEAERLALGGAARASANNSISLGDKVMGVLGAAAKPGAGFGLGYLSGDDSDKMLSGLAGAGLAMGGNKLIRTYGNSVGAKTLSGLANAMEIPSAAISPMARRLQMLLQKNGNGVVQAGSQVLNPAELRPALKAVANKDEKKRK